ncbi:MAG TPA: hypothetical protein VJB65_05290, partial [Patescibacteria group bacterium]|nr:hypothetical protein [Patescibacteria group bacterium]
MSSVPAHATDYRSPELKIYELQKKSTTNYQQDSFLTAQSTEQYGGSVAVCNLNKNKQNEIVVGAGQGERPTVKVYSSSGELLSEFLALPEHMKFGLNVACGNLDGKGRGEIVVGAGRGGSPYIRVFTMKGKQVFTPGFFAYHSAYRGGVFVAVGNIDGKKGDEIIAGTGHGQSPEVRVFNREGVYMLKNFFPFAENSKGGVSVGVANIDGGKEEEILMAQHSFGGLVKVYKADEERTILGEFKPFGDTFTGGINIANAHDINRDTVDELMVSP